MPRFSKTVQRHHRHIAFSLQGQSFPTAKWAEAWENPDSRWQFTKAAYTIQKLQEWQPRGVLIKQVPRPPKFVYWEARKYEAEIATIPHCEICHLPKEFCITRFH